MDVETDGSSNAARSAPDPDIQSKPGLISRLFGARNAPEDTGVDIPTNGTAVNGAAQTTGLGQLTRLRVDDVAIPKVEIVAVPDDISKDELIATFRDSGMTRLPVYDGTLDTPLGLVHLKDLALKFGFNGGNGDFNLRALMRPLLFAPPSMPIGVLMQKMQSERRHMALVIDEYGGVDGLLTIEDLIEQVVGEIEDEHDADEVALWVQEKPGCYMVQARAPLDEFEAEIGVKLLEAEDEEEADTLGGLVFMLTGRVPTRGEVVGHPSGAEFEVMDADPRRIKRLRVWVPDVAKG
ncbi:conjugal transfer protein [Actibacterium mucosum KCTC 23349]|uniref:Conjugal transfer protein n=1 Tax=Actibacterium mucosum KCTC 23349 TaxID=1454373 RepID=A0A037ZHP7_9RHOB|nr:hemolysin family protein [Actibacterium mucosum]KAJ55940.1 conjugal transfer protein [Actibacterium mucosum KCTC 23349]